MGIYIAVGEVIEGAAVDCITRRWDWKGPKKHPITGKRMTLYISDRNSDASITKERPAPDDEEMRNKTSHFHRSLGDTLKADAMSIYVDKMTKITPNVKEGVTHRHGANIAHLTSHTIAEIRTPIDNQKKALGMGPHKLTE